MNAPAYKLNANEAREGSGRLSSWISATGGYAGMFTKAKSITASTGATGIEFDFLSKNAEQATFTLYTHNKEGEAIYGMKQLQALMAVLALQGINPRVGLYEEWDHDEKAKVKKNGEIYPDLMNKPVGVVFQMEEYESTQDGTIKKRPNFFAPFHAQTKQMAAEILDQKPAAFLDKVLMSLKDKLIKKTTPPPASNYAPAAADTSTDDIPW